METLVSQTESKQSAQERATELLDWLIAFLPGTIPPSAEDAILDVADDVHALFWHRSELKKFLDENPNVLNKTQQAKLTKLDRDIRAAALLLVGAAKGMLHRYRKGRYDRSHWWWCLDDILIEESFSNPDVKLGGKFAFWEEVDGLPKAVDGKAVYKRKSKTRRRD
jgi:hypothetical protein